MKDIELSYIVPVKSFSETAWIDGNKKWIQVTPFDKWDHPMFGETVVERDDAIELKQHFDDRVLGVDVHIDYEHGMDKAYGKKASGKYIELDVRDDGLWGLVEFTNRAKEEIEAGEWNYFSPQFNDRQYTYVHPHTGVEYQNVLRGGGLTNAPWVKGMAPLNFSELAVMETTKGTAIDAKYTDGMRETAVLQGELLRSGHEAWSPEYVEKLPDSAFLYVNDGNRHFPVKDETGKVDLNHVRRALIAAPNADDLLDKTRDRIVAAGTQLLTASKSMSDVLLEEAGIAYVPHTEDTPYVKVQRSDGVLIVEGEMAEKYFREPGVDADVPDANRDDAADDGWRRETPPGGNDGSIEQWPNVNDLHDNKDGDSEVDEAKLRATLGIGEDEDIIAAAEKLTADAASLVELRAASDKTKNFSETYPEEFKRMKALEERDRENEAKSFSEAYASRRLAIDTGEIEGEGDDAKPVLKTSAYGLSARATNELAGFYKSFSEGAADTAAFRNTMDAIFDGGIVEFGSRGSAHDAPNNDDVIDPVTKGDVAKAFSEAIVAERMAEDKPDYEEAMRRAAGKNPALAQKWLETSSTR